MKNKRKRQINKNFKAIDNARTKKAFRNIFVKAGILKP